MIITDKEKVKHWLTGIDDRRGYYRIVVTTPAKPSQQAATGPTR